jgi:hydrogenase maturation protease
VIVVDAALGTVPGRVHLLDPGDLGRGALAAVSSHGIDLPGAVALAGVLHPGSVARVRVVAVEITRAARFQEGLSEAVREAVPRAASAVLRLLGQPGVEDST